MRGGLTRHTLLCEEQVWLQSYDLRTHLLNELLLQLQQSGEVCLSGYLNVGLNNNNSKHKHKHTNTLRPGSPPSCTPLGSPAALSEGSQYA